MKQSARLILSEALLVFWMPILGRRGRRADGDHDWLCRQAVRGQVHFFQRRDGWEGESRSSHSTWALSAYTLPAFPHAHETIS